ncbi:hypothetical protein RYH80_09765 [Halobaculum sp. MBLA0147]|uniref:hypothetical protein n=1 Tax=Halobaculum sp. MBLA0147 TaxID=3079934 RepID=UPI0035240183
MRPDDSELSSDDDPRRGRVRRAAAVSVLLVVLAGLLVGYGVQFAGSSAYPDAGELASDYPEHVGERVHLWTTVVAVRSGGETATDGRRASVVVAADPLELVVVGLSPDTVSSGDHVQVYGELRPGRRIAVTETVVVSSQRRTSLYVVSVVGILFATGWFLRRWRLDTDRLVVVPRLTDSDGETREETPDETGGGPVDTDTSEGG